SGHTQARRTSRSGGVVLELAAVEGIDGQAQTHANAHVPVSPSSDYAIVMDKWTTSYDISMLAARTSTRSHPLLSPFGDKSLLHREEPCRINVMERLQGDAARAWTTT